MKTKIITIALLLSLFCFGFVHFSQTEDPFITALKNTVSSFYKTKPFEKVYLHIDKSLYKPGEDIWFKAFVTDGATNLPSKQSDVVYIELINPRGNVDKSLTLQVIQGVCFGSFTIDESYAGGLYKIKAYTTWMKNFGVDYYFEKEIQIQKVVYPRLLAKIDFKRESFSPGDTVKAELKVETLGNVPFSFKAVKVDISLAGEKVKTLDVQTDNKGKVMLHYVLPENLKSSDGLINAKILHEGSTEAVSRSIPIVLNKINIDFLPEGGYPVANIPAHVAFKAVNEFGKPAEVEGYVTDNSNNRILEFSSFHQGMGAFEMVPVPGKRYFAVITKPQIKEKFELPEVMPRGYTLRVISTGKNRYKAIYHAPQGERIHFAIQSANGVYFTHSGTAEGNLNEIEFPADKFPTGTAMATLFDRQGNPRCERLMFFNFNKHLNISLKFDKDKYNPREKIKLNIRTTDKDSIPVAANLSLAVVNDQLMTMADDKQHNILSWMLLGSEIKGKVEKPEFYFNPEEPRAEKALNYLLLTQGWRRYYWNEILKMNYNVLYPAERIGSITGTVRDKRTGEPIKAEVIVIELENHKRILKVNSTNQGRFRFENADASSHIQVLARSNEINISDIYIEIDHLNELAGTSFGSDRINRESTMPDIVKARTGEVSRKKEVTSFIAEPVEVGRGEDIILSEDIQRLDEIVVVGYGTQRKSDVTGAVTKVTANNIQTLPGMVDQALQGRVPGVNVINDKGQPGLSPQVTIRGTSSLAFNNPLYVIDGVIYDPSLSGNKSILHNIPVSSIESISVLKDASATSIYGYRAVNGVILISTSANNGYYKKVKRSFKPRYSGLLISPRRLSATKEFYYPVYKENEIPKERTDFRSTIYWNPSINTNNAGSAEVEFYASDEITTFRAVAEGIGSSGDVGRTEKKFYSQLPFSMAVKFPAYVSFGDTVVMPLILKNNTSKTLKGKLQYIVPENLNPLIVLPDSVEIAPYTDRNLSIPFFVRKMAGKVKLAVNFDGGANKDAFTQEIDIQPKGFPTYFSVSAKEKEKSFSFEISKAIPGSLNVQFTAYPDIISDLLSGIESILREPYGCFEQTSSCTYPNIMVLQFLKTRGLDTSFIAAHALKLIKTGYTRLKGFETSQNGFEWFGHAPGHLSLTAYGLMEFTDMKAVYDDVDEAMMDRTLKWILKHRDGKGNFKGDNFQKYSFGGASDQVTNAYVVYALSEAGIDNIDAEYNLAVNEALKSGDPYRLALMANAAFNYRRTNDGNKLIELLKSKVNNNSWDKLSIEPSFTRSYGKSLQVETASLFTMALLKSAGYDWNILEKTINFILSSRSYGSFGSTQATILALKALTTYSRESAQVNSDGEITILVNGNNAASRSFRKGDKGKITLSGLEKYLHDGTNKVMIRFSSTESTMPYAFDASWNSATPASHPECKLLLTTSLSTRNTKVGETVRLNAKVQNISNDGLPMTMAIVGIPSGLSLQPWQLKEIQEKGKVDFYEVNKNFLVLYYREMAPGEVKEIKLDLRSEIAGTYQAPASCTYLYYTSEIKYWVDGEVVKISR